MADDSKKRLLQYALGRLGRQQLAVRLKVSEEVVEQWLTGSADMTHNKALRLADLVNELNRAQ